MSITMVAYGGGVNSTAMLAGLFARKEKPNYILFADTGGERPETYSHISIVSKWLLSHKWPGITVVMGNITLEQDCLNRNALPSLAYGFKTCSQRFKARPQDKYIKAQDEVKKLLLSGERVKKLIGFDAGESRRAKPYSDKTYIVNYPLIDWGWDRDRCILEIKSSGLPVPPKSSCFFCPATKSSQIRSLSATNPDLIARAIEMEKCAKLTAVKGLGRTFSWESLLSTDDMFKESFIDISCDCYDG